MADQSQIRQLQTPDNQTDVFPITLEKCIFDSNGMVLSQKMTSLQSDIATVEPSSTSAHAYAVGDYLMYSSQLYRVTQAIAVGDTLTVGTNIEATDVGNEIIPSNTAEGNPISFDSKYQQDAVSTKLTLSPIQDLHGYDHPWVGGAGKNKLSRPYTYEIIGQTSKNGVNYQINSDGSLTLTGKRQQGSSSTYLFLDKGQTPTALNHLVGVPVVLSGAIDGICTIQFYTSNGSKTITAGTVFTITQEDLDATSWNIACAIEYTSENLNNTVYPMLRLATETDATFEPYTNICPISGRTEVGIEGCGKNLFNGVDVINANINSAGIISSSSENNRTIYIKCLPNTQYTISKLAKSSFGVAYCSTLPTNKIQCYGLISNNTASAISIITGPDAQYLVAWVWNAVDNVTATEMLNTVQVELGNIATAYNPYQSSNDLVIFLGQTVYDGTVDVEKGELVITDGYIASYNGETLPSTWISDRDAYAPGSAPTTGAQVVYKFATPTVIPLTPAQVHLLKGINNISTDGDNITLIYKNNPYVWESEVENKADNDTIAPVEKGTTVSQAYSVGQYMMWGGELYKVTANIANGGTITPGTNVTKTTIAAEFLAIISRLS